MFASQSALDKRQHLIASSSNDQLTILFVLDLRTSSFTRDDF